MRKILFRGKIVGNGKWVYGGLFEAEVNYEERKGVFIVPASAIFDDDFHGDYNEDYPFEIDPDTVGQYIGVKDKNGKRVFEGDIVKDHYGRILLVEYRDKQAKFVFKFLYTMGKEWTKNFLYADIGEWFWDEKCPEVIGNKWDNPELLWGTDK